MSQPRSFYRFTFPGYGGRPAFQVMVPVAARIIGDDISELVPFVAESAANGGYRLTDQRWCAMTVEFVVGVAA